MKNPLKKLTTACAVIALSVSVSFAAKIVIKAAHTTSIDYPYQIGLEAMKKSLESSVKDVDMQIFPNGALGGDERKVVESIQLQTITMTVVNGAVISNFTKKADVFGLPFIFRDINHLYAAMDGQPGKIIAAELEKKGIKVIAWYANPDRHMFTRSKLITNINDIKGMKIRVTQSPVAIETFKAFGALPTPMAYGELYSGLQQGVVDGGENDWFGIRGQKFYEVAPKIALTGHFMVACPLMVNLKWYNSLPANVKKAFDEAAAIGQKAMRDYMAKETSKIQKEVEAKGGVVIKPVTDIAKWREASKAVYPKFYDTIGKDLIDMVINIK
ncbi:MAG: TRAP transporter substrate-binding protein [Elusimicrobiota bacterium]|jgi:tripartite ATP-independent transporter DctP family solute receptor|nr:TRAP transporter substrate-binding protein [Elusimicrobiota bacterium]